MSICPICLSTDRPIFTGTVLNKYVVTYFFCDCCGFLHTEKPYWLGEAYSDAIVASDTGIVRRNLDCSAKAAALFMWLFAAKGKYVDMAGGYGLFTRLMRDFGFDYYWSDPYASNFFARGFVADFGDAERYIGSTAFEAIEHVENPLAFISSIFQQTHCEAFLFSTELYPGNKPPAEWAYYARHSGQHISFLNRRTLNSIAAKLQLNLYSSGGMHLLTKKPVNQFIFRILASRISAKIVPLLLAVFRATRIAADSELLLRRR